jgi:hypothetical protein
MKCPRAGIFLPLVEELGFLIRAPPFGLLCSSRRHSIFLYNTPQASTEPSNEPLPRAIPLQWAGLGPTGLWAVVCGLCGLCGLCGPVKRSTSGPRPNSHEPSDATPPRTTEFTAPLDVKAANHELCPLTFRTNPESPEPGWPNPVLGWALYPEPNWAPGLGSGLGWAQTSTQSNAEV